MADYHHKRVKKLQAKLRREKVKSILITDEHNVTYLTGFTGDSTYFLVTGKSGVLISDTRYTIQIAEECPHLEVHIRDANSTLLAATAQVLKQARISQTAYEADSLTKAQFDALEAALEFCELVSTVGWTAEFRAVKDKLEIAAIRKSVKINEQAFKVIREQLRGEQSELEVAHNLEHQIRAFGGTRCAFDPIVGVGPRSALPHGIPSQVRMEESPFVLIDWGAQVDGYASDLTRVLFTGRVPSKLKRIYETVLNAQRSAIRQIKPGATFKSVDQAARKVIQDAGFGSKFGHGTGHGFGLQIHETPYLSPIHEGTLQAGMVVTVEPGIYLHGWGGVRIEDDVLVTKNGHEVISSLPKELDQCHVSLL